MLNILCLLFFLDPFCQWFVYITKFLNKLLLTCSIPCVFLLLFSFGLFYWLSSNLWWIQSSLPLSFYSKVSTYSHTFSSKYYYFIPERLVCMFYTILAMEVHYSDLLKKNELWGHNWLTGPLWHSPRPHFPILLRASDWAQQGCQGRAILLDVELLWWTAQDCAIVWSSSSEILLPFIFFLFSQMSALHQSLKVPWPTPAPSLFILQRHFPRVATVHLILH